MRRSPGGRCGTTARAGGLGILAGDFLKEASDSKVDMTGVGLLYRYGYFKQIISGQGEQIAQYDAEHFSKIPIQPVMERIDPLNSDIKILSAELPWA